MKPGSLVECIDGYPLAFLQDCAVVKKGDILTVRGINSIDIKCPNGDYIPIVFYEHINPECPCGCGAEMVYNATDFRELQPPMDISIESLIQEPQTV